VLHAFAWLTFDHVRNRYFAACWNVVYCTVMRPYSSDGVLNL